MKVAEPVNTGRITRVRRLSNHFASTVKNFVKKKTLANGKRNVREAALVGSFKHTSVVLLT